MPIAKARGTRRRYRALVERDDLDAADAVALQMRAARHAACGLACFSTLVANLGDGEADLAGLLGVETVRFRQLHGGATRAAHLAALLEKKEIAGA